MAKEIYLSVDGKQVTLTDEQLKALGLYEEPKKSLFKRVKNGESYYCIISRGVVCPEREINCKKDEELYDVANYCTDRKLMQQRAWHETLNRLLWRFSMENDGDKIDWNNKDSYKYHIYYDKSRKSFDINYNVYCIVQGIVFFYTKEIAKKAIDEIVLPFMEQHPEFVW